SMNSMKVMRSRSGMRTPDHRFSDRTDSRPSTQDNPAMPSAARLRLATPNRSTRNAVAGSSSEIDEVHAATARSRKNNSPYRMPNGIASKASGSEVKSSPGPPPAG